jgi:WD40 repeat protein
VWDEESGRLHRQLEGFAEQSGCSVATFLSVDRQQARLVAGSRSRQLRVYDPEAGSVLHRLEGHTSMITDLACIASSSAAPHHPRIVAASQDGTAKVWDGETGELLGDLPHEKPVRSVAVWKEHTGGHDRIATSDDGGWLRVWHGEAFTLIHELKSAGPGPRVVAFRSAEGPASLLSSSQVMQVWDPEEGRLLHDGIKINRGSLLMDNHLFESAQGRHLLDVVGHGEQRPRRPFSVWRPFMDVWDLGEAPAREGYLRPAHHRG